MKLHTETVSDDLFGLLQKLLKIYSRDEMLTFFARKYAHDSLWNVEKSLTWFDDAENEPDPHDLRGRTWEEVKQAVLASARL